MERQIDLILIFLLLTIAVVTTCWAAPVVLEDETLGRSALINDKYLDADMLVALLRNGKTAPPEKWPNATVYYKISSDFDISQVANIVAAMAVIESATCVRFHEAHNYTKAYVDITSGETGCFSFVGYRGKVQKLNLQTNIVKCFKVPIIIHELLHSLGFFHEHASPERDDYISIIWENIQPGNEQTFKKLDNLTFMNYGYSYDYDSIMHYGRKAFSVNQLDTIVPLDSNAYIGQRQGLSPKDIGKINAMYNCSILEPTQIINKL